MRTRILIVDDSPNIREAIQHTLGDTDTVFFECDDGSTALAAYKQHLPDWVLMDIQMKLVDGFTAARAIRAAFPVARIIFVSQFDNNRFREIAESIGGCGYVLKQNLFDLRTIIRAESGPSLLTSQDQ